MSAQPVITPNSQENYPNIIQLSGPNTEVAEVESAKLPELFDFDTISDLNLRALASQLTNRDFIPSDLVDNPFLQDISRFIGGYISGDNADMATKEELIEMLVQAEGEKNLTDKDRNAIKNYLALLNNENVESLREFELEKVMLSRYQYGSITESDKDFIDYVDSHPTSSVARLSKEREIRNAIESSQFLLDNPEIKSLVQEILTDSSVLPSELNNLITIMNYINNPDHEKLDSEVTPAILALSFSNNEKVKDLAGKLHSIVNKDEGINTKALKLAA